MSYPVYLDHNATTPLAPEVIAEINQALVSLWGNPSSSYAFGQAAKAAIDKSRSEIGQMLNAGAEDIIFVSGGTEANNVALLSAISRRTELGNDTIPHVITSNVEHDSIIKVLTAWFEMGKIELTIAKVSRETGCLAADEVLSAIKPNTCLVSVMHSNNETGILMPIAEIGKRITSVNVVRESQGLPRIYFHTDAAQTIGKIPVDVRELHVDYLTVVGHKFYGPRIGALYIKNLIGTCTAGPPLVALQHGGGQERGFRPGTENTPMIVGLGTAASLVWNNITNYYLNAKSARDRLQAKLLLNIPDMRVNFTFGERLPNTLSIAVPPSMAASDVLKKCSDKICASLGAACHSSVGKPSSVLISSGLSVDEAKRTIRLSVGRNTSHQEIELAVGALALACKGLS